jgi:hypothetical protein
MASALIYREHDSGSQTYFEETKQLARSQRRVLSGTPGMLKQRTQSKNQYWVREYIRVDGKKTDEYIGSVASTEKAIVERLTHEIDLAKALAANSRHLRLFGYQRIDRKPAAVLEVFFNKRLFQAGLTLVGSHAYGALLNEVGVVAPSYKTQDIDFARGDRLTVALPAGSTFQSLLETLAVDLLVPGGHIGAPIPVPELATHAQAIPLLEFLIADPVETVALSPNHVVPIRVPSPENFALHKIYSSQARKSSDRGKIRKDLEQAAVLAAVIEEETPGRLMDAFRAMPRSGKPAVKRGCMAVSKLLGSAHEEAKKVLGEIAGR